MDLKLDGRVVIVTGDSSGIGLATIERLAQEGARVATCARRGGRLTAAVAHLDPDCVLALPCDVEDRQGCERFVDAVLTRFGRLDALVNNAGRGRHGGIGDLTDADWQAELGAKVFGVLNPTRAAIAYLAASDAPRIINISGGTAREPRGDLLAVGAARAAVSNLSRGLAAEYAPSGVLVNTVSLGVFATARAEERHQRQAPELPFDQWGESEASSRGVQLGRLGRPDEAAVVIAFLASPLASYVTGATVDVSGGLSHAW